MCVAQLDTSNPIQRFFTNTIRRKWNFYFFTNNSKLASKPDYKNCLQILRKQTSKKLTPVYNFRTTNIRQSNQECPSIERALNTSLPRERHGFDMWTSGGGAHFHLSHLLVPRMFV